MKKLVVTLVIIVAVLVVTAFVFLIRGSEDRWICDKEKGEWWEHGVPSAPKPEKPCGEIDSFEECVAAGNPAMESYPRRCQADDETFVEYIGNELEKLDLIRLDAPRPNGVVTSPLVIEGEARGYWFFEGDFPVVVTDWDGLIIAENYATAEGEWMTEEFVPFRAVVEFDVPSYSNRGTLILRKDNPSGLPEHDDALEIPILFGTSSLISRDEAFNIARESRDCSMTGVLTDKFFYNENTKTWWIDLERMPELEKDGCNPACVVNEETKTAEVNWRCTGFIPE
jgi:hypothetical protein